MAEIPKLIKDTSEYFNYEGSANPTTQDEMQAFLKNLHSTVVALTDSNLWQASTVYKKGKIIHSPNMKAGYFAVALVEGTSGTNEPSWGDGTSNVTDGSISWLLTKGNITVNGVKPDASGNITIDIPKYVLPIASQAEVNAGTNNAKAVTPKGVEYALQNTGYWKASEYVTVGTIRFLKGAKYAGYYLKCTTAGTTGTTQPAPSVSNGTAVTDGSAKWILYLATNASDMQNATITVTATQIPNIAAQINSIHYDGSINIRAVDTYGGVPAGTFQLRNLLQQLVNLSHNHKQHDITGSNNCNCKCDCCSSDGDCSCIISGNILTNTGYKDIKDLAVNDYIIGNDGEVHKVVGIKKSKLGNRKAVSISHYPAMFTDDHLYMLKDGYGSYDVSGYYREASRELTDGNVYGTYARLDKRDVVDVSDGRFSFMLNKGIIQAEMKAWKNYPADAVTYTPIIEDCEWCIVDGLVVACARYTF